MARLSVEFKHEPFGDHEVLALSNDLLRVDLLPQLGARVWNLYDIEHCVQWIWHHPSIQPQRLPLRSTYDDHWAGGWEQLFPNDAEGEFKGRLLPDHGEWWTRSWEWETTHKSNDRVEVHLFASGAVTRSQLHKWVVIEAGRKLVSVRYRIENLEDAPLKFLFKEHMPVNVSPHCRLELPGGIARPVDPSFSTRIGAGGAYDWPYARGKNDEIIDLAVFPPAGEGQREFVYVRDLPEGWCGVTDTRTGRRLRMSYPLSVFPYAWFFMTFGGWRDIYTVVLEPCTNMPKDLATAERLGQCASLAPGEALECEVQVELS